MHCLLGFFVALLLLIEAPLVAAQPLSPVDKEQLVEDTKDWWGVYCVYLRFGRKADGIVAEAFVEKVSLLLADKWESLRELGEIGNNDRQFVRFVMTLLGSGAYSGDRARKIREKAVTNCPSKQNKELCHNIVQAIDRASRAPRK